MGYGGGKEGLKSAPKRLSHYRRPLDTLQACLGEAGLADIQLHPCPVSAAYSGPLDLARFSEVSNYHFITATKPKEGSTMA